MRAGATRPRRGLRTGPKRVRPIWAAPSRRADRKGEPALKRIDPTSLRWGRETKPIVPAADCAPLTKEPAIVRNKTVRISGIARELAETIIRLHVQAADPPTARRT